MLKSAGPLIFLSWVSPALAETPASLLLGEKAVRLPQAQAPVAEGEETTLLAGRLLYEDHRRAGRPDKRQDINGQPGARKAPRTSPEQRFLGAWYMTVDVFERDDGIRAARGACAPLEWVGEATVGPDGRFSIAVPVADRCPGEDEPRYVLRARTGHCVAPLCFQVGKTQAVAYELWFGAAQPFRAGTVGDLLFSPAGEPARNDWSKAANHYASLVEAVVAMHVELPIPFRLEEYGPVAVRYPSPWSSGRATRHDLIDMDNRGWPEGNKMMHEYGHILHRRAWGGDYGGYTNPVQRWRGSGAGASAESSFIAFKEGWANFIERYVGGRCFREKYDTNYSFPSIARDRSGLRFPENHHRALCDWVDDAPDRRIGIAGEGDVMSEGLYALWQALDQTDDTLSAYDSHDPVEEGLDFCDLTRSFLAVQKSPDAVGELEHRRYTWQVSSLLENNDLSCPGVPAPRELLTHNLTVSLRVVQATDAAAAAPRLSRHEIEVRNPHPFMPSPSVPLEIRQDGELVRFRAMVPPLSAGEGVRYPIVTTRSGEPRALEARLLDSSPHNADPGDDVVSWVVEAVVED